MTRNLLSQSTHRHFAYFEGKEAEGKSRMEALRP